MLRWMEDGLEQDFRGFDRDRYPAWRDWAAGATAHRRRAATLERFGGSASSTCRAPRWAGRPARPGRIACLHPAPGKQAHRSTPAPGAAEVGLAAGDVSPASAVRPGLRLRRAARACRWQRARRPAASPCSRDRVFTPAPDMPIVPQRVYSRAPVFRWLLAAVVRMISIRLARCWSSSPPPGK